MDKNQRIELLKDVFTLVGPDIAPDKTRQNKIETWLKAIVEDTELKENPWREQPPGKQGKLTLLPQFMQLLRECILSHQWADVLSMLNRIALIPCGADWAAWKAAMTTLYTEPERNLRHAKEFFKHTYLLKELNVRDVALEFVQYLLSLGLTEEASQVIQTSRRKRKGIRNGIPDEFTQYLITMLDSYQGLIYYVDWKAAISRNSASSLNTESQSFYDLTSSQGLSEDVVRKMSEKALLGMGQLVKRPGVWDIFLTKCVEIHEFYNELEKGKVLLCEYREKNPDNPNSHRLLYDFLTKHCQHFEGDFVREETLSCLKSLAKLDPAYHLVLDLCQTLTDTGEDDQAMRYLFDLLDFGIWQNKSKGWHYLAKSLKTCLSKEKKRSKKKASVDVVKKCWATRGDWWPSYHFNHLTVNLPSSSKKLLVAKATVAAILMGKDNQFNSHIKTVLKTSSIQRLESALSELDWDLLASIPAAGNWQRVSTSFNNTSCIDNGTQCVDTGTPSCINDTPCVETGMPSRVNDTPCVDNDIPSCNDNDTFCVDNDTWCVETATSSLDNDKTSCDNDDTACIDNDSPSFIDNDSTLQNDSRVRTRSQPISISDCADTTPESLSVSRNHLSVNKKRLSTNKKMEGSLSCSRISDDSNPDVAGKERSQTRATRGKSSDKISDPKLETTVKQPLSDKERVSSHEKRQTTSCGLSESEQSKKGAVRSSPRLKRKLVEVDDVDFVPAKRARRQTSIPA